MQSDECMLQHEWRFWRSGEYILAWTLNKVVTAWMYSCHFIVTKLFRIQTIWVMYPFVEATWCNINEQKTPEKLDHFLQNCYFDKLGIRIRHFVKSLGPFPLHQINMIIWTAIWIVIRTPFYLCVDTINAIISGIWIPIRTPLGVRLFQMIAFICDAVCVGTLCSNRNVFF